LSESIVDGTGSGNYWRIDSNGAGLVIGSVQAVTSSISAGSKTFGSIWAGSPATQIRPNNTSRISLTMFNNGTSTVYLGKTNTISGNGFPFISEASLTDEDSNDAWFAYLSTGSNNIRFIEVA